jgi:hypothetical protein
MLRTLEHAKHLVDIADYDNDVEAPPESRIRVDHAPGERLLVRIPAEGGGGVLTGVVFTVAPAALGVAIMVGSVMEFGALGLLLGIIPLVFSVIGLSVLWQCLSREEIAIDGGSLSVRKGLAFAWKTTELPLSRVERPVIGTRQTSKGVSVKTLEIKTRDATLEIAHAANTEERVYLRAEISRFLRSVR